ARPVDVELLRAEPVCEAARVELDELGAQDVAVEGVRALPVGDGDHDVVECGRYSHSIVEGGFDEMSSATRFTPGISLMIRLEIVSSRLYGSRAQSAVIASSLVTARITIGYAYVRSSPWTQIGRAHV